MTTITLKSPDLEKYRKNLVEFLRVNPRAISQAMNRTASVAQTSALKQINNVSRNPRAWNIGTRDLKRYVSNKRASVTDPSFVFTFKSGSVSLLDFVRFKNSPYEGGQTSQNKVGVRYKLKKAGGSKVKPHAFINTSTKRRGTNYVLLRDTPQREPITPQIVVSPSYMFADSKAGEVYVKVFTRRFNKRYINTIEHLLKP